MTSTLAKPNAMRLLFVAEGETSGDALMTLPEMTSLMRKGSDAAWQAFHERYYLSLLRYAASRGSYASDSGEILQEAYLRIARHVKQFREEAEFWRWLTCVVRCAIIDHYRGARRRALLVEKFAHWQAAQNDGAAEAAEKAQAGRLAAEALAALPPGDAQILRLKYYEGWSVQQLAEEAGSSPKAIENRLARLRRQLRESIAKSQ